MMPTYNAHITLAKISRISTVFYMGIEGLGGLDMETDEDENVCAVESYLYRVKLN
jgi:hypothetical protein